MGMTKAGIITLLLVLAFAPAISFAVCPAGKASALAPAVIGERGQMLELTVEAKPGDGQIYVSAEPSVGISTQNSERIAVSIASRLLDVNMSECDFFVRMSGDLGNATSVDGPSAGAAMTLLAMSALSGAKIMPGLAMTGTIESDGTIGSVGSVSAKARAAAESGIRVFLTPRLTIYERLLLDSVRKDVNITVVEVRDIIEAGGIAFSNETPKEKNASYKFTIVPADLAPSGLPTDGKYARFREIARQTIEETEAHVQRALARGNGEFDAYFLGEMNASRALLEKGYTYSAANLAFLTQTDASVLETAPTAQEVETVHAQVADCIDGLKKPKITDGNYEEVFAGEMRQAWARRKLAEAESIQVDGEDSAVFVLNELEYARGWCGLAKRLYSAPTTGRALDEGRLEQLAFFALNRSWDMVDRENIDTTWHADAAGDAFKQGDYGAALYDATYAYSMSIAENDLASQLPKGIGDEVALLNAKKYSGMWPVLYQSQARYYASGENASIASAFRLAVFADQLDAAQAQINGILLAEEPVKEKASEENAQQPLAIGATEAGLLTLLAVGALLILAYEAGQTFGRK